ncbi:DUF6531 domain-containing protein [Streptomyces sp. NPDC017979]|uniref:DUF6531 domain-containing protein n=1 Tax=Streptomyces sp. NPDC017979 TaxID=3365024 RepID=UPI0037A91E38
MGYTIPEGVDTMLDVVGVGWPNVDEDAYRDMADALREFADDADDDAGTAHGHIQRLLSTGQSESLTALDKHWKKVQGKNKDLAGAARIIAGALDRVADIIVARKIAAVGELADLCATVGIALAAAPFTAGLTALLAGGKIVATRIAFKKILKEMAEAAVAEITATLTQPAVAALESIVTDLAIQTAMDVTGADDSTQLNSAGGGGSGGAGGTLGIDHDAHGNTGGKLANVQISMNGRAKGKIDRAKGHHGRAKGKDSLTAVLDGTIEGVVEKLIKGHNHLGNHVGKKLPDALGQSSKTHRNTDKDIDDRLKKITGSGKRDDDDLTRKRTNPSDPARKHPDDVRTQPASLDDVKNDPRRHSVPLDKKTCRNDPIDVATGEMTLPQTDLVLPGVLSLALRRTHLSGYRYGRWFGRSWASTLDERIELDAAGRGAIWAREDGSVLVYPRLPAPDDPAGVLPLEGPRLPLVHGGQRDAETSYLVTDAATGTVRTFTGSPYGESAAFWLREIEDRNGNGVTFQRRPDGAPTRVVHDGGYHVATTVHDGRITELSLRTPDGPVTVLTYGYDHDGNLDAVTNSSGLPFRFGYDADARITSWTDRNDSTFQYAYDPAGRVVRTVGPDGALSSSFAYETDPATGARTTRYTDSTGATTVFHLNDLLQLVAETDANGATSLFERDRHDRLLSSTDPLGRTIGVTYDADGSVTSVTRPDGRATTVEHDGAGLPVLVTQPDGRTVRQEYDDRGNRTSVTGPTGLTTRFGYDGRGRLTSTTDPLGRTTSLRCDDAGLVVESTDPLGAVTGYAYDAFGRPVAITDPLGRTTRLTWSTEGRLLRRVEADGSEQTWTYDGEGNVLGRTDPAGGRSSYEYGAFDRLSARTGPDGARHEFAHDTELRLTRVTDPRGLTWTYEYDPVGRLTSETDFDGRTLRYGYDPAGQLTSRTNALDETTHYAYNALGQLVRKDAAGAVTEFAYDVFDELARATGPDGTLDRIRDALGLLRSETVDGRTLSFAYDEWGRPVRRTTPSGAVSEWTHDAANNLTRLTTSGRTLTFQHDALGRELTRTIGSSLTLTHGFDESGRLTEQHLVGPDGTTVQRRGYGYRADGHLTDVDDSVGGRRSYTLDAGARVTAVAADTWSESYAYDAAGNQTAATWPTSHPDADVATGARSYDGNRLTEAGGLRYEHDAQGRVVLRWKTRLSRKPETWRYTWDADDRLVGAVTPDGAVWRYRYDPLGRRSAKQRLSPGGEVLEETTFTWEGSTLCEQTTAAHEGAEHPVTLTWDHRGLHPVAQTERILSATREEIASRFFSIVTDLVGTPTELVDEQGEISWRKRSTLWGTTLWNRDATAYTPLRFPGQYFDPETGLHYNVFRTYDPETARYLSPDPLGLFPAPNPSTYVHNPLTWSDHLGLAPDECTITVYRKQTRHPLSHRIHIDENGNVRISGKNSLYVNMSDDIRHTTEFRKDEPGQIVSFEVPKSFVEYVRRDAVPQEQPPDLGFTKAEWKELKKSYPEISDPTRGTDLYGLPNEVIEKMRKVIIPGSGKIVQDFDD